MIPTGKVATDVHLHNPNPLRTGAGADEGAAFAAGVAGAVLAVVVAGAAIAVGATAVVAIAVLANLNFLSCMTIFD